MRSQHVALALALAGLCCAPLPENEARPWTARDGAALSYEAGRTGTGGISGGATGGAPAPIGNPPSGAGGTTTVGTGGVRAPGGGGSSGTGGMAVPSKPPSIFDPLTPADAGPSVIDAGPVEVGGPVSGCALTASVTTISTNRDYAPLNVGAIWIADARGKFVKTLTVWAGRHGNHLLRWVADSGDAGRARDTTDAVTSATARNHGAHKATWDCTDTKRAPVPAGYYQLCVEMTESNSAGGGAQPELACGAFAHDGRAASTTLPAGPAFKDRQLSYMPR
jgi:hypothetical protein